MSFVRELLGPDFGAFISITGGGGKTSLMLSLAEYFTGSAKVILSTTTKIKLSEAGAYPVLLRDSLSVPDYIGLLKETLERVNSLMAAGSVHSGKLTGLEPEVLDEVWRRSLAGYLLAEADGSRGLSFKGYAGHEPVVPSLTTKHFVVAGADAFITPVSDESVFRLELLERRWGVKRGEIMPAEVAARILESGGEYLKGAPQNVPRTLLINKSDMLGGAQIGSLADALAGRIAAYGEIFFVSLKKKEIFLKIDLRRKHKKFAGGAGELPS